MKVFKINIFLYSNFVIFKNKSYLKIIAYGNELFLKFNYDLTKNDVFIDIFSKSIGFNSRLDFFNKDMIKRINYLIKYKYMSFFFKIKFNGKGFRIQSFKAKKLMNFTFGHSHMYYMYLSNIKYKKINKYKYHFLLKEIAEKNYLKNLFKKIKPINKYTLRGLRISRTTIIKRKGRKSPNLEI